MRRLTGKYRITKKFWGWKIEVQIYKVVRDWVGDDAREITVWRKATVQDLIDLKLTT